MRGHCPFCLPGALDPEQILVMTSHLYLLAPRGQITEGYFSINTHVCRDAQPRLRCMDDLPMEWQGELEEMRQLVEDFYRAVYGAPVTYYEHGRGGGAGTFHPIEGYAFHPHLCTVPGQLAVHERLERLFEYAEGVAYPTVRQSIGKRPYLLAHSPGDPIRPTARAYYGSTDEQEHAIQTFSIKRALVADNALPGEWDWRRLAHEPARALLIE